MEAAAVPVHEPAPEIDYRGPEAYVAEFIGTLGLVFFITMVLSVGAGLGYADFAVIGLVHVFVLAMLIHTLGGTSGAHFNPAVTVALLSIRKIAPLHAAMYLVCQFAGGLAGAALTYALLEDEGRKVQYGSTLASRLIQGNALHAAIGEALGTFFLMWAIMGAAVNPRAPRATAALIIGGTLGAAVMILGPVTGAGFNPARSFGPAVFGTFGQVGDWIFIYVAGPVTGAVVAAGLYTWLVLAPKGRIGERPVDHLA
jgi:glycerol uptake facilitator protein